MGILNKLADVLARLKRNESLLDKVVNGGIDAFISTDGGIVPSLSAVMHRLGDYPPTGAWTAGTLYRRKDLVTVGPVTYVCLVQHEAGTFSADLSTGKWAVHQGLTAERLGQYDGAGLVGCQSREAGAEMRTLADKLEDVVSVRDFGRGLTDGDDWTEAVRRAFASGRPLFWPRGVYRITSPVPVSGAWSSSGAGAGLAVIGDGDATQILHEFDGALFVCTADKPAFHEWGRLKVLSNTAKSFGSVVFQYLGGITRSRFYDIRVGHMETSGQNPAGVFDCAPASYVDTVRFEALLVEGVKHQAYGIGKGSSVWFDRGRVIGGESDSLGIRFYGGNGGIWLSSIDLIGLGTGALLTKENGESNREVFGSSPWFDSSVWGLVAEDSSYISITDIWAASCSEANIQLMPSFSGNLILTGGTIFNGGIVPGGEGDGLVIDSAHTVMLSSILIRYNNGYGLRCTNGFAPNQAVVDGCLFEHNRTALLTGGTMQVSNNMFMNNETNIVEGQGAVTFEGNRGIPLDAYAFTFPASGEEYVYNGTWPVQVYIRNGGINSIWLNGTPIYENATNVTFTMRRGDVVKVIYYATPAWLWKKVQ